MRPSDCAGDCVFHAAEAAVIQTRIGRGLHARTGAVAAAIRVVAEIGPPALHAFSGSGFVRIEAVIRPRRFLVRTRGIVVWQIPVRTPLLHVAGHVIEPVPVWAK